MSQVPGSNAAGEVFANFKINTEDALTALKQVEDAALQTAAKVEKTTTTQTSPALDKIGKSATSLGTALGAMTGATGAASGALGQMAGAAGPAGTAIAAVLAAALSLEKGIREFNNAAAGYSNALRTINDEAGYLASNVANATGGFEDLERAARSFSEKQLQDLQDQIEARSLYAKISDEIKRELGGQSIEEAKINQILVQREQLIALVNKRREEAFGEAADAALLKRQGEDQLREANALAALEKELQASRRAALTEQERKIEELEEKLRSIEERRRESSNPQARAEYERYAQFFAAQLRKEMAPIAEDFAAKIMDKVRSEFTAFESGSATAFFGRIEGSIDTIAAQLQSRGMV